MNSQEIRKTFLGFFAGKGHKIVRSSSLLPKDDPTILFTNAGMNQFKNIFLGLETRSYKRAVSVQKCLRVSGKHNDLEQVGRTPKHHTFFEMLGNFSFGDYFKEEAIAFAWELVTGVFRLDTDRLYVTVYEEDDEAHGIWAGAIGVPPERIFRFGKRDNYWAMGDTGPCGPCSEIHYDLDSGIEAGDPRTLIGSGSDRFVELWNLVFMEKFQDEKGGLQPLPSPSIDTGMGLERMAAVLQGKTSNYSTDLFMPLIDRISDLGRRAYPAGDEGDAAVRIIADHVRAITFLIGDGITPANEGRGYVLRRLIRRAFRYGNLIGIEKPFLHKLTGGVGDMMRDAYPELIASMNYIARVCLAEEERFAVTLASGLRYFDQFVKETRDKGGRTLAGDKVFKLYDTFGFPLDLSQELAAEKGLKIDEGGFRKELEEQKDRARRSWKGDQKQKSLRAYEDLKGLRVRSMMYEAASVEDAEILALFKDGARVAELQEGDEGEVVLDVTPFYAEAGGQTGDTGFLKGDGFSAIVENSHYLIPEVAANKVKVLSGRIRAGDRADGAVDAPRRSAISGNHTATHLLHAALRHVLGDHVKQAGSLVSAGRLRFDFTHFAPLSREEIRKIEDLVNEKIREDLPVESRVTTLEEGIREGAMAIFEEKYGEKVRLVRIGDFSRELCGGIHAGATGRIGLFKIVSEAGIAAGMRRIEALTGGEAVKYAGEQDDLLRRLEQSLSVPRREIAARIEKLQESLEEADRENKNLRRQLAGQRMKNEAEDVLKVAGIPVLARRVENLKQEELRELADSMKQKLGSGIVILGSAAEDKVFVVVSVTKDLTARFQANRMIKEIAPLIGGGGGGRPDFAQAGGTKPGELSAVLEAVPAMIERLLQSG